MMTKELIIVCLASCQVCCWPASADGVRCVRCHLTWVRFPVGTPCPGLLGHAIYRRVSAALIPPVDDQQG